MALLKLLLQYWISLLFLISSTIVSATPFNIPELSVFGGTILQDPQTEPAAISEDFETFFYDQTLDHFNYRPESYSTFKQRYVMNSKYWGGGENENAPIFVYFGAEGPFNNATYEYISFLIDNAPHFKALLIYIEHRYYGESIPFGSMEEAMKNDSIRGYFNSAQAMADYAEIILHVKKNLSAQSSPVIVIGGSYGGMLASWFRLKYPHIALGALASSAPILYFDDITPHNRYYEVVTQDFKEASESCYQTILESWSKIDNVSLSILSQRFKTCSQLYSSLQLKNFLVGVYANAAQYNQPPRYPVTIICGAIDGASPETDILGQIFAGVDAYLNQSCYINTTANPTETSVGWGWQECTEMVIPIGRGSKNTMFEPAPFNLTDFIKRCKSTYGIPPRPHWVTTYYGGHDIKLVLKRFASNIIFSNGLKDPYSSGGVLENISDTLLAISTVNGSHCLDIVRVYGEIPDWLAKQRQMEIEIIEGWIKQYYADLRER